MHAIIKVKVEDVDENGEMFRHIIETTVGRIIFNQSVPKTVGYINQLLTKKSLRTIISDIYKKTGNACNCKIP